MAQLGEFVGAMLADAVQARVRADVEALKVAEAYSGHELLKHMPVPRFRVPDITIDFPVIVSGLGGEPGSTTRLFAQPTRGEVNELVKNALAKSGVTLTSQQQSNISAAVHTRNTALFKSKEQALLRSREIAHELAITTAAEVTKALPDRDDKPALVRAVDSAIRDSARQLLVQKITQSPHLQVAVNSAEIKGHADTDSVVKVRLTITEDAFEIVEREDGGYSLVPE